MFNRLIASKKTLTCLLIVLLHIFIKTLTLSRLLLEFGLLIGLGFRALCLSSWESDLLLLFDRLLYIGLRGLNQELLILVLRLFYCDFSSSLVESFDLVNLP